MIHVQSYTLGSESADKAPLRRLWRSTGNLFNWPKDHSDAKQDRSIRFSASVKVVLIPDRLDYKCAELSESLWWGERDYEGFKIDAVNELKAMMVEHHLSGRDAVAVLYQGFENAIQYKNYIYSPEDQVENKFAVTRSLDRSFPITIEVSEDEESRLSKGRVLAEVFEDTEHNAIGDDTVEHEVRVKSAHGVVLSKSSSPRGKDKSTTKQRAIALQTYAL